MHDFLVRWWPSRFTGVAFQKQYKRTKPFLV